MTVLVSSCSRALTRPTFRRPHAFAQRARNAMQCFAPSARAMPARAIALIASAVNVRRFVRRLTTRLTGIRSACRFGRLLYASVTTLSRAIPARRGEEIRARTNTERAAPHEGASVALALGRQLACQWRKRHRGACARVASGAAFARAAYFMHTARQHRRAHRKPLSIRAERAAG